MTSKRILAIDYGKKRIGVAVSDPLNMFAIPLVTIPNNSKAVSELLKIVKEKEVKKIVLGYPSKEDGSKALISEEVEKFKTILENKLKLEVTLFDERYSSTIAWERIIQTVPSREKRREKGRIDKGAAAVILEDYLNSENIYFPNSNENKK